MTAPTRDISRSARLSDAEHQALLDKLDADEEKRPVRNKRSMPRVGFRKHEVAVRILHPGGTTAVSYVTTRNLSAGGMSFLNKGFLHHNTKVEIILRRRLGGEDVVAGTVVHCALVNRSYHLIGVRFANKIFPKLYLDPNEWGSLNETLVGTVLHFDEQEMDRMLLGHFLEGTKIKLISTGDLAAAREAIQSQPIDCILCDLANDGGDGTSVIVAMREAGFVGPMAIVTAETLPQRLIAAQCAGAGVILSKPYDAAKLRSLLSAWLTAVASGDEPIRSTMADDAQMKPMIEQYVQRAHDLGHDLHRAVEAGDLPQVRHICQIIKGTASGFGFASISDIARDTVHHLDTSGSLHGCSDALQQLEVACLRASA